MNAIYNISALEGIRKVILTPGANDTILHIDSDDDGISKADLIKLASKGLVLVQVSGVNYEVLSFAESTDYATVTIATVSTDTFVPVSYHSAGYVAG